MELRSTPEIATSLPSPPKSKSCKTPTQIIDNGKYTEESLMDLIETLIINGKSYRQIAKALDLELSSISRWLSKEQRYMRMKTALRISADYYADMSIQVLKDAPNDKIEIMRAKELSSAYRWMARVRDVSKYGEKIDVTSDGQQIVQVSLGSGIAPPEATKDVQYIDVTDVEQ
jgi:hypothetical protein